MSGTKGRTQRQGAGREGGDVVEGVWLSQPDPVGAWLDVLMGLVALPAAERRAIRDELDSHLRDRVRDLMLSGTHESEATRVAIAELGDAAELALNFGKASRGPARRRLAMNIGMLGMAGAALVTSMVALMQPAVVGGGGGGSVNGLSDTKGMQVYSPSPWARSAEEQTVLIKLEAATDIPVKEALTRLADAAGLKLVLQENVNRAIDNETISFPAQEGSLAECLAMISERSVKMLVGFSELDYRINGDTLRVATSSFFDLQESVLVILDLHEAVNMGAEPSELVEAITTFVEPNLWVHNGGDIGRVMVVGQKLFVKAPPRMIEGARWIVGQFSAPGGSSLNVDGLEERRDAMSEDLDSDGQPDALTRVTAFLPIKNISHENFSFVLQRVTQPLSESMGANMPDVVFSGSCMEAHVSGQLVFVQKLCAAISKMDADLGAIGSEIGDEEAAASAGMRATTVDIRSMPAIRMIDIVEFVIGKNQRFGGGPQPPALALSPGINAVVIRAMPNDIDALRELVAALDFMPCAAVGPSSAQHIAVPSGKMPLFRRLYTHAINSKWSGGSEFPEFRTLRIEDEVVRGVATDEQFQSLSRLAAAIQR